MQGVEIGVADARVADLHEDLVWSGLGDGDLFEGYLGVLGGGLDSRMMI